MQKPDHVLYSCIALLSVDGLSQEHTSKEQEPPTVLLHCMGGIQRVYYVLKRAEMLHSTIGSLNIRERI